jgi:hypothetical protein
MEEAKAREILKCQSNQKMSPSGVQGDFIYIGKISEQPV